MKTPEKIKIPKLKLNSPFKLKAIGSWSETWHVFEQRDGSADAIRMALAAERPLLVRGDPGTGKSQLARAAAQELGRLFVSEVVHSRTEPQDLQWRFDAISRLGEAQTLGLGQANQRKLPEGVTDPLDPRLFLNPSALWWVFGWHSAFEQHKKYSRHKLYQPVQPEGWSPKKGAVLLIDEIDKADSDLPNSLLETLGNRAFHIPWLGKTVGHQDGDVMPLVIITTNEERELPAAFIRRCLVLDMSLPDKYDDKFLDWLCERGRVHFPEQQDCDQQVLEKAAGLLIIDRKEAKKQGVTPPGQAEYIDLLTAITRLDEGVKAQCDLLDEISHFALKKYR